MGNDDVASVLINPQSSEKLKVLVPFASFRVNSLATRRKSSSLAKEILDPETYDTQNTQITDWKRFVRRK